MKRILVNELKHHINNKVCIKGWVERVRKLKKFSFIILRERTGRIQCVVSNDLIKEKELKLETIIEILGKVKEGDNKISNLEIEVAEIKILNEVKEDLKIEVNKEFLDINMDTMLNNRVLSLRHPKKNSIFKIQNAIVSSFREFLIKNDFTEIFTPKLVAEGAEGGTEVFEVKYFDKKAYLAQSPQFYKQMMVASGFERVFEIAPVYRAEEHNTNRHLNEYISMDLEIGFIENEETLMDFEEELLKYILKSVEEKCSDSLEILGCTITSINERIPRIKLSEAIEILESEYGKSDLNGDIDPEGEKLIYKYVKEKYNSEFVFLTHYPKRKRPMYTKFYNEEETNSFDLLFRGVEITTGGQRIHNYEELIQNIRDKGLKPKNYKDYTENFKYGMPPHGGLAIGLERITTKLLNLENVREASLFPRDRNRLIP